MSKEQNTILDIRKALGFGVLYQPIIGKSRAKTNPFIKGFRPSRPSEKKIKKTLV